jgi:hypothetical protein
MNKPLPLRREQAGRSTLPPSLLPSSESSVISSGLDWALGETNNQFSGISYDCYCHLEKTGRTKPNSKTEITSSTVCQQPPKYNSPEPNLPVGPNSALLTENSLLLFPPVALRLLILPGIRPGRTGKNSSKFLTPVSQQPAFILPSPTAPWRSTLDHLQFCYLERLSPGGQMGGHSQWISTYEFMTPFEVV